MADNVGTYQIRTGRLDIPGYAESGGEGLSHAAIKAMLSSLQPGYVAQVGDAYTTAATALGRASDQLHNHARRLTEAWSGENAGTALRQLGQLNTTAAELQEKSAQTGRTFSWLGTEILPWYRDQGRTMTDGHISTDNDDQRAIELLDRMDNRIAEGHDAVPDTISKDLPTDPGSHGSIGDPRGPGVGDTGTGNPPVSDPFSPPPVDPFTKPGDPFTGPGDPSDIGPGGPGGPTPGDPGGVGAGVPDAGSTDLAGAGGGIGADPFGAGGPGGGLGGGAGGLGAGAGGGGLGAGGGVGLGAPLGSGAPGPLGPGGAGKSSGGRSGSTKAGQGPLLGGAGAGGAGGAGDGEEERERTTWLTEDEDVWGDDTDTAPPVIG
jgi:hypothetical protein